MKKKDTIVDCIKHAQKEVGEGRFHAMWFYLMVAVIGALREIAGAIKEASNEADRRVDRDNEQQLT